jgi:hypothetical protein
MKNQLAKLLLPIQTIDRRYFQLAYMVLTLALFMLQLSPDDGSGGH